METKFTPNVENIKIIFRAATIYLIRKKQQHMLKTGVKKCDNKKYDHDVNDCRSQLLRHFLRLFGFLSRPWHMLFLPLSISLTLFFSLLV